MFCLVVGFWIFSHFYLVCVFYYLIFFSFQDHNWRNASPFLPSSLLYVLLRSLKFIASLFTNCYCVLYVQIQIIICMYLCIHKLLNIVLSLYNVVCVFVLRDEHLVLDNQLMYSLLGRLPCSFFQCSSVACSYLCRVEALWVFLSSVWHAYWCHFCSAHVLLVMLVWIYVDRFWYYRKLPDPQTVKIFLPHFWQCFLSIEYGNML